MCMCACIYIYIYIYTHIHKRKQQANHDKMMSRTQTREYRTSTPLETRRSLARCVSHYLSDDENRAFKDSNNHGLGNDRHHTGDKRTLLNICFGQDIGDKNKIAPRQCIPKWEYADKLRIATLNVRGMEEFAKRGQIIQEVVTRSIVIMCIQETKLSNSTIETKWTHICVLFQL